MLKTRKAFTLLELLVVIAIIAILSAIIVPVFTRAKDSANRSADLSSMNTLRSALALYRIDQGGYPPALLGFVTLYTSGPLIGQVIPANSTQGYLYPKRVAALKDFTPAYNRYKPSDAVNVNLTNQVTFPDPDQSAVATNPLLDLNGDGAVSNADDTIGARQAYGIADGGVCWDNAVNAIVAGARCGTSTAEPRQFYPVSGYDIAQVPTVGGGKHFELRYARFWTNYAIGSGPGFGAGASDDDPRQLGYNDPPEDTIITWNSYFRDYSNGGALPDHTKRDLVLYLNGSARPFDSRNLANNAWRQERAR